MIGTAEKGSLSVELTAEEAGGHSSMPPPHTAIGYASLSPNVYRFLPVRLKGEDLARIHGTNERVGVESYGEAVRFYAQLIRNGAGG